MKRKTFHALMQWAIVLATLTFVGITFHDNWQELRDLEIQRQAWVYALVALGVTLLSHLGRGLVWGWILANLGHPVGWFWAIRVYLWTDIAKYLPGDVWHMYGRVRSTQRRGIPLAVGTASVLLDPLFTFAGAMVFALFNLGHPYLQGLSAFSLGSILIGVHPPYFRAIMQGLSQWQKLPGLRHLNRWLRRRQPHPPQAVRLGRYPLKILLGTVGVMGLQSASFLLVLPVFEVLRIDAIAPVMGGFSFAWIMGVVLPGASGGIGVFEAIAIALLGNVLQPGILLGAIGMYRLITILVTVLGAGIGWLMQWVGPDSQPLQQP